MSNAGLLATATKLISANGASAVHRRIVEGSFDPILGENARSTVDVACYAVLDAVGGAKGMPGAIVDNTGEIVNESKRLWIAGPALSIAPVPGDRFIFSGKTWQVVSCEQVNPDGTTYLYNVVVQ